MRSVNLHWKGVAHQLTVLLVIGFAAACSPKEPLPEKKLLPKADGLVEAPPSTAADVAVASPSCAEIWADTTKYLYDTSTAIDGGAYRAYRMKQFRDDVPHTGKWIGAFKNMSEKEVDPFPDNHGKNHTLQAKEKACLFMKAEKNVLQNVWIFVARLERENGGKPTIVKGLMCGDTNHADNVVPVFTTTADQCKTSRVLQVGRPVQGGYAGFTLVGDSSTIPQLIATMIAEKAGAEALGLNVLELQAILAAKGTWFPCSSNGCCRGY